MLWGPHGGGSQGFSTTDGEVGGAVIWVGFKGTDGQFKNPHRVVYISLRKKVNAYSKLGSVDKIRMDHPCTTLCNYKPGRGLLRDSLRLLRMLPRTDPRICCVNSSYRVGNLCSTDTQVCKNCMDRQYNHSDRRNLWLRSEIGTEHSFRMDWDRKDGAVAPHLVQL